MMERFRDSADELQERATERCGLSDFGNKASYLPGLNALLESMDVDPRFTPAGRALAEQTLIATLVARARAEQLWKDHPEWRETKIERPIVIVGLARTGSTALHKLMGSDPQFQGIENWLSAAPMPRPRIADATGLSEANALNEAILASSPGVGVSHRSVADEIDECVELLRQSFVSNRWTCTWTAHSYDRWWQGQDEGDSYRRYADLLRLIGCHEPKRRWLLKNPATVGFLEEFFACFPDACVIQTHRDPVLATASIASTMHHHHIAYEGEGAEASRSLLGPREMDKWATFVERGAQARTGREMQFFDVHHGDFHRDPMGTIGRIYDYFGLTLTAEAERAMQERVERDPNGHGQHRYDLASFGLSRSAIIERYRGYMDRFDVTSASDALARQMEIDGA